MGNNIININKYLYFDKDRGMFALTDEAAEIICRKKEVVCSYSGADEWCNHFVCELIDLYSGSSKYNYALSSCVHETRIPELLKENPHGVYEWIESIMNEEWGSKVYDMFITVIDDLPDRS